MATSIEKLARVNMPDWQSIAQNGGDQTGVEVCIERSISYGGIVLTIANILEVYVEKDAEKGIVVRIWTDADSGNDPTFQHEFPLTTTPEEVE